MKVDHRAWFAVIPVAEGGRATCLLVFGWLGGLYELACIASLSQSRHYVRRDGTCAAQRLVMDQLADPDWINQMLVSHPGRVRREAERGRAAL